MRFCIGCDDDTAVGSSSAGTNCIVTTATAAFFSSPAKTMSWTPRVIVWTGEAAVRKSSDFAVDFFLAVLANAEKSVFMVNSGIADDR